MFGLLLTDCRMAGPLYADSLVVGQDVVRIPYLQGLVSWVPKTA